MSPTVALAVSFGLMGGLAAVVFPLVGLVIWAAFIAWACYVQLGASFAALKRTITGNIFGAVCAWAALTAASAVHISGSLWMLRAFLVVALSVGVIVLASAVDLLSSIPASILGYAATFAYIVQTTGAMGTQVLLDVGQANGLVNVSVSMVAGALIGAVAQGMARTLARK